MRTEDGHFIQRCLDGEKEAFAFLVDKYKESVFSFAYAKLHNIEDAEDITQEVFLKAFEKLHTLRRWDNFALWLHTITNNLCLNLIKSRAIQSKHLKTNPNNKTIIESTSRNEDPRIDVINEALKNLPDIYQQVITLYYLGDMNSEEISKFLGLSANTIRQRLNRARLELREEMLMIMDKIFEQNKLKSGFTFRIMEIVKQIRIQPISITKGLPLGLSFATGIMALLFGIGQHIVSINPYSFLPNSALSGEISVQKTGEYPVNVIKMSDLSALSRVSLNGDGLGFETSGIQNALFMAPQIGDTWTKKADMPTARYYFSASVANGKIYAFGGCDVKDNYLSIVEEYDPMTDKWTKKTDMPAVRGGLSSCTVDGKIYVIGGYRQGAGIELTTVEEYDPVKDKWTRKADMPTARQFFSVNAVNGKIYALGGWRLAAALSTVEEYDPIADKWTKKSDMPATRYGFSAEVVNGKIYVIGGCPIGKVGNQWYGNGGVLATVDEYDPMLDKWTQKTDMPTARMFLTTSTVNRRIYAIGGYDIDNGKSKYISTAEEYDPVRDTWTKKTDMSTARFWTSSGAVNGKIYVIGGLCENGIHGIVEEYDTGFGGESINPKGKLPTTWGETKTALNK